jgi:hypothetical protein
MDWISESKKICQEMMQLQGLRLRSIFGNKCVLTLRMSANELSERHRFFRIISFLSRPS